MSKGTSKGQSKGKGPRTQLREREADEALAVARGSSEPGQSKVQTRAIARGIARGIAQYKAREKARLRDQDRARKRRARAHSQRETDVLSPEPAPPRRHVFLIAVAAATVASLMAAAIYLDLRGPQQWQPGPRVLRSEQGLLYRGLLVDTHLDCASGMLSHGVGARSGGSTAASDPEAARTACEQAGFRPFP